MVFKIKTLLNVIITSDLLVGFGGHLFSRFEFLGNLLLGHRLLLHNFLIVPPNFFVTRVPLVQILVPKVADAFGRLALGEGFVGVLWNISGLLGCVPIVLKETSIVRLTILRVVGIAIHDWRFWM